MTGSVSGKKFSASCARVHLLLCSLLLLGGFYPAHSQEPSAAPQRMELTAAAQRPAPSELEKQNVDRVSAAPEQIRAVLVKDPGLLVELKRWIAKEAAANGQLIDDFDLTDQAVFDRLGDDIVFRAAATRMLQRFGYLLPAVNPDSPLGKEQELVLKERARRIVQIESQEDSASLDQNRSAASSQNIQQVNTCNPGRTGLCPEPSSPSPQDLSVPEEGPGTTPDFEHTPRQGPAPPGSPILQAGLPLERPESASVSGNSQSDPMWMKALGSSPGPSGAISGAQDGVAEAVGRGGISNREPDTSRSAFGASRDYDRGRPASPAANIRPNPSGPGMDRDSSAGTILHKSNPYSDIPSLYDLYVQVAAHDRTPQRFGVDILRDGTRGANTIPMDLPVGPDYVLGPGDGLAIDLWGGVSQRLVRVVDREGRIALPESGPLLVTGKTLGEVQSTVQESLRGQYKDVSADVSLSRLRTVRVYVVGEVAEAGAYDVSSLSTPLNALVAAGGITSRGSLRSLKHYRGKQLIEVVDAYDLLLRGVGAEQKRLENGDSLLVPPAGPEVTVEGMVRRPAIYELRGEASLEDVLELAGGLLPAAALEHVEVERLVAHQKRTMFSLDLSENGGDQAAAKLSSFGIQDGDRIHIFPIAPYNDQAIYLEGHVLKPGRYSYREGMKLSDLLSSYSDLLPEPAGNYAEIIRLNAPDYRPTVESFDLTAALANPLNAPQLMPLDTVRIFSRYDFEAPPGIWVGGEVRSPGQYNTSGQARLRDAIFLAGGISADASLASAQLLRTEKDGTLKIISVNLAAAMAGNSIDNLLLQPHDRILVQRNPEKVDPPTVYIKGEVAKPGRYPLTSKMRVEDLISVAGGLKRSADSQSAILTHQDGKTASAASVESVSIHLSAAMAGEAEQNRLLNNGDVLTIRENPGWNDLGATVTLRGEIEHPGTYGIRPGESLNEVLQQAGGFTAQAYPYATVLTRQEVRDLEMRTHQELIGRVKAEQVQLKALPEDDSDKKEAKLAAIAQTETTLTQLETNLPLGRVVLQTSPDMKSYDHVAANTALRNGDVILVPKEANYVLVNGQVFNPTAVGYVSGRSAKWYLGQAGGVTQLADKKAVFVIRANGSVLAARNNHDLWSGDPLDAVLMPGDSIVVPEKAAKVGSRNWTPLIQSAQIATSIGLAVAYLRP
ncbi:MAG: SLBB domain-containing protein [Candidatus Acidiferrum sp.]